jgi:predicted dehydrogenase
MLNENGDTTSRRDFLKTTAGVVTGGALAGTLALSPAVHAAGGDVLRVGLIGCGGRGTGAAGQALNADKNVKLVAMGDAFRDRLDKSLATLQKDDEIAGKIDVKDRCFVGFDAYKQVLDCGVDVVLLTTPPHFRPLHLKAAVDAGKHVFAEKPVAVDAPGVRSVLATCAEAKKKNLSILSGLCLRFDDGHRETVKRIQDGAIGDIAVLQANDLRGPIWMFPREKDWSDMEWQMRNWYYFTWLSGDFNVEQHVHLLDLCAWLMKEEYPVRAVGLGGRQVRTSKDYGHIYDHHSVVYEYANGMKVFSACRQQAGCKKDITVYATGTNGSAVVSEHDLWIASRSPASHLDKTRWRYRSHKGKRTNMYQIEHDVFFASIRSGTPINHGDYMSKSTLMAIMGRMATYTGQEISWQQALNSREDLTPAKYEWGAMPMPLVAIPGQTKVV